MSRVCSRRGCDCCYVSMTGVTVTVPVSQAAVTGVADGGLKATDMCVLPVVGTDV